MPPALVAGLIKAIAFHSEVCNFDQALCAAPIEDGVLQPPQKSVMNRNSIQTMTALTAWAVALCCPHCGRTGTGTVSESSLDRIRPVSTAG
jgi:hypothetical protein